MFILSRYINDLTYVRHKEVAGNELAHSVTAYRMLGLKSYIVGGPYAIKKLYHKEQRVGRKRYLQQYIGTRQKKLLMRGYNILCKLPFMLKR